VPAKRPDKTNGVRRMRGQRLTRCLHIRFVGGGHHSPTVIWSIQEVAQRDRASLELDDANHLIDHRFPRGDSGPRSHR